MYHLLVKFMEWSKSSDTMREERIFEYTDKDISSRFLSNGSFRNDQVISIPALFVNEIGSEGSQNARVGQIHSVKMNGGLASIAYSFDANIPSIPNAILKELSAELRVDSFEFSRTHWAIKDADLYKVLFANQARIFPTPKVFTLNGIEGQDSKLVSLMMPFSAPFNKVHLALKESVAVLDLQCLRVDDIWVEDAIIQDIVSLIYRSKIVICDCTGRNPNVFYEAGIAHTLGRDVILIAQDEGDVPFDLRHLRYIEYSNSAEGRKKLARRIQERIKTILVL